MQTPKSLTATIHVRFNHKEQESTPIVPVDTEILARILDQTSEMPPELQELVIQFANYLNNQKRREEG